MVGGVLLAAWLVPGLDRAAVLAPGALAGAACPVALGALIAAAAARFMRGWRFTIPPGDVLVPIERALRGLATQWQALAAREVRVVPRAGAGKPRVTVAGFEQVLRSGSAAGVAVLLLLGLLVVLLALG
jgi:hypothetical protein